MLTGPQDELLKPLSSFQNLKRLELAYDFEIAADDSLYEGHRFAWYRRCFLRRYSASQKIAAVCPMLELCELGHDMGEDNYQRFQFVVREEAGNRVVRPVREWWMTKHYRNCYFGPLPEIMVEYLELDRLGLGSPIGCYCRRI